MFRDLLRVLLELQVPGIYEWRVNTDHGKDVARAPELAATGAFRLQGDSLIGTIEARNQTAKPLEIGDLGVVLPLNTEYVPDRTVTYTKQPIRITLSGVTGRTSSG
jgi:hypothetical protein